MKTAGMCSIVAVTALLIAGQPASGTLVDFDFSIEYSGSSITGRLVGLDLDASGNGTNVDPSSVLLFSVPDSAMLPASGSQPYVFMPVTFERSDPQGGTMASTTPGVYGFQVSNYTIDPKAQNLVMSDAASQPDVILAFNFGFSLTPPAAASYGIVAGEQETWPAMGSSVSFTAVPEPATGTLAGLGLLGLTGAMRPGRRRRSHSAARALGSPSL